MRPLALTYCPHCRENDTKPTPKQLQSLVAKKEEE